MNHFYCFFLFDFIFKFKALVKTNKIKRFKYRSTFPHLVMHALSYKKRYISRKTVKVPRKL